LTPILIHARVDDHFVTKIGVGKVIKGWDEGVPKMSLGERAKLTITPYNLPSLPPPVAGGMTADIVVRLVIMGMVLVDFRLLFRLIRL
jgi:hypothetical protein